MKIKLTKEPAGTLNLGPWPPVGTEVEVSAEKGNWLIRHDFAKAVAEKAAKPRKGSTAKKPAAKKAPAKKSAPRKRATTVPGDSAAPDTNTNPHTEEP